MASQENANTHILLFDFKNYIPKSQKLIDSQKSFSTLSTPDFADGDNFSNHQQDIIDAIENDRAEYLEGFNKFAQNIFSQDVLNKMVNYWPSSVPNKDEIREFVLFYVMLINQSNEPMKLIKYAMKNFSYNNWHDKTEVKYPIRVCCTCKKGKELDPNDFNYALLDDEDNFKFYHVKGLIKVEKIAKISSISTDGKCVSLFNSENKLIIKFTPSEQTQCNIWSSFHTQKPITFPLTICGIKSPVPDTLICTFYDALTNDDFTILRTLVHYTVAKVSDGLELATALLDIFSYAGKVNYLLTVLVGLEFEQESLTPTTVLRGNSHLTWMFKVFYDRFGRSYFNDFLEKIIKYIDDQGDLNLKEPDTCTEEQKEKIKVMFFTILKNFMSSGKLIPQQMRHFASILKALSAARFNDKNATFNTLSGFFCLRFVTALLANPPSFDSQIEMKHDVSVSAIPFSQLLQIPFNLVELGGRFLKFADWNESIEKIIFPKLEKFVYSIADLEQQPVYPPPSKQTLKKQLEFVLEVISRNHKNFEIRYNYLKGNTDDEYPIAGWDIGTFLMNFFKNDINDKNNK